MGIEEENESGREEAACDDFAHGSCPMPLVATTLLSESTLLYWHSLAS